MRSMLRMCVTGSVEWYWSILFGQVSLLRRFHQYSSLLGRDHSPSVDIACLFNPHPGFYETLERNHHLTLLCNQWIIWQKGNISMEFTASKNAGERVQNCAKAQIDFAVNYSPTMNSFRIILSVKFSRGDLKNCIPA